MQEPEEITYDTSWGRRRPAVIGREILLMWILRPLIWVHVRPKVYARDRLDPVEGPVIFASNHASHLDTPVLLQSLPKRLRRRTGVVAAADYFFNNRLTAWFVTLAFATLPIERRGVSARTRERIERMLAERWSMLVFPEGTRSTTGRMGRLKSGTAHFSLTHDLPIVPVYLTGTHEAHGKGSNWPSLRYQVTVRFGSPIPRRTDGDHRALTDELHEAFTALAAESGRLRP